MDLRDLGYFAACAELGHMHRAAEQVGRSQPALSKAIRRLELELGARLFERQGRGIRLTVVGETLLHHARRLSIGVAEAKREVTEAASGRTGHVRLGTGPTTADWLLPPVLERALADAPGLTLQLRVELGASLRRALRAGELDVVVGPLLPSDREEFSTYPIGHDTMVVAARPGHALAGQRRRVQDLADQGWLLPSGGTSKAWLFQALAKSGVHAPRLRIEASGVVSLRRVVMRTDLLTFLSRRDLSLGGEQGLREIDVPELRHDRRFAVLSPATGYIPQAAVNLVGLIRKEAKSLLRQAR